MGACWIGWLRVECSPAVHTSTYLPIGVKYDEIIVLMDVGFQSEVFGKESEEFSGWTIIAYLIG